MYIYRSHLGGFYTSKKYLDYNQLYCEDCGDSDVCLGEADTWQEAVDAIGILEVGEFPDFYLDFFREEFDHVPDDEAFAKYIEERFWKARIEKERVDNLDCFQSMKNQMNKAIFSEGRYRMPIPRGCKGSDWCVLRSNFQKEHPELCNFY